MSDVKEMGNVVVIELTCDEEQRTNGFTAKTNVDNLAILLRSADKNIRGARAAKVEDDEIRPIWETINLDGDVEDETTSATAGETTESK